MRNALSCLFVFWIASLIGPISASEETAFQLLANPRPWHKAVDLDAYVESVAETETEGDHDISFHRFVYGNTFRVIANQQHTLLGEFSYQRITIDADDAIQFTDSGTRLPDAINYLDLGLTGRYVDTQQRRWVYGAGLYTRTDDIADDEDARALRLFAAAFIPTENMNGWTLGLRYNSIEEIPIPIIAYTWMRDRDLMIVAGLPFFMVNWNINQDWSLHVQNFALNPGLELRRTLNEQWRVFGRLSSADASWAGFIEDRADEDLRIKYRSWRLGLGARSEWKKDCSVRLEIGYAFEGELSEEDATDFFDRDGDDIDLDDTTYARLTFKYAF